MDFFLRVEVVKNFGKEAELFLLFFDEVAVAAPLTGASTPGPGGFAVWRGSATVLAYFACLHGTGCVERGLGLDKRAGASTPSACVVRGSRGCAVRAH